jgi:methionyl-tRNA synthetase
VGRILEVEELNATRKPMYLLKVDLGDLGVRTIIAGIRAYYAKEELLNTCIVVVANLEPKKIGEYVSEGMLLAAQDGEKVRLIRPDIALAPGSKIG